MQEYFDGVPNHHPNHYFYVNKTHPLSCTLFVDSVPGQKFIFYLMGKPSPSSLGDPWATTNTAVTAIQGVFAQASSPRCLSDSCFQTALLAFIQIPLLALLT